MLIFVQGKSPVNTKVELHGRGAKQFEKLNFTIIIIFLLILVSIQGELSDFFIKT